MRRCGSTSTPSPATTLAGTLRYIDSLRHDEFAEIEAFLTREAKRYGIALRAAVQPATRRSALYPALPQLAAGAGGARRLDVELAHALARNAPRIGLPMRPSGDIVVFAVFHEPADGAVLDRSTALEKGLIAVANLFADRTARGTNQIVLAHELLHTLSATDKYSLSSNAPVYPDGYAAPESRPLLPQTQGRAHGRPHSRSTIELRNMPASLREVVIGPATAREIGWQVR